MDGRWRRLGSWLSRRSGIVSILVVAVTALSVLGLARLDFATGQDSYMESSSAPAVENAEYQRLFGGESMVVLLTADEGTSVADLFTPANVERLDAVEADLSGRPEVAGVVSPVALLRWSHDLVTSGVAVEILGRATERDPDEASQALRQTDTAVTAARLAAAGEQSLANPAWVEFLVFDNTGYQLDAGGALRAPDPDRRQVRAPLRAFVPDGRHAVFAAVLVGNASLDQLAAGSQAVHEAFDGVELDGATTVVTGTPTFLTDINDYLQGGMLALGAIAVAVMLVILVVAFKVRWRLLPLLAMLVGVVWGFGAFGATGTMLSLVTIAGLPILIGLGIEFAIQIQNRVEEERAGDHPDDPFGATLQHLGPPLLTATVAAVIAFLVVRISRVPMVRDFGVLLSLGIVALLVAGIAIPLAVIGWRERHRPTAPGVEAGWVEATVRGLGSLPRAAVLPLVLVAVVIPIVGLAMEGGTRIESDPVNWANQSSQTIRNVRVLERDVGFASTLGLFVRADPAVPADGIFTDQMGRFQTDLVRRALAENTELRAASSLATTVAGLIEVPGATPLAPTGLDMLRAYQAAPPALQRLMVADDGNAANILFQVGPSSLEQRAAVLDRVEAAVRDPGQGGLLPPGASATTGGLAVVGVALLDNITANRAALTIVALVLVSAFVVLRGRDLGRGALTMIPVLLAVGASATVVRLLGITLSPLTTVGGPLVVATCAEFSILLIDRYAEERARGRSPDEANAVAARRTGRAFFTSALTTLGGFAVLMFSSLPLLSDFGRVVTINIAVALLAALVVVPPLVKAADGLGFVSMGSDVRGPGPARSRAVGWLAGAALLALGVVLVVRAAGVDEPAVARPRMAATAEAPATIPPSTTTAPTTTPPSTVASGPAGPAGPAGPSGTAAPDSTLPPGSPERPAGLVAGAFYDALVAADVDAGVARCAADDLISTTPEADLLAMGVAQVPRPPEVDALLAAAGARCGVTPEQLAAAAAG